MMPKITTVDRQLLEWRKPGDHPQDMDDALLVANGFGGRYAIQEGIDMFLLWLDDDEFTFKSFSSIYKCKLYAECRFQKRVRDLFEKLKA